MVDFKKMDSLIDELVKKINEHNVTAISIEENGVKVEVRKENGVVQGIGSSVMPAGVAAAVQPVAAPKGADDGLVAITSPMVGTFYRSPSPDSPAFVEVGDTVQPGKTVCIIEAMKLFNEIEAESAGQVVKILVENGKPVEFGQKIMLIRPAA